MRNLELNYEEIGTTMRNLELNYEENRTNYEKFGRM
jgi:hypothetical protein